MIGGELFAYKLGAPSEKREVVGRMAGTTQEQQLVVFQIDHRDSLCGVATRGLLHHPGEPDEDLRSTTFERLSAGLSDGRVADAERNVGKQLKRPALLMPDHQRPI
jgi:hypothetical protein